MSFAVRLSTDHVAVEAGANAPISVEISNRSEESDRFEMEVEGLDPEWTAVPVPTFTVAPSEASSERIFFRTPRTSESLAGNYPFVVRVRSLTSGEVRTAQGVLQIASYHHVSVEISPKKGNVGPFHPSEAMVLTLMNLGNSEHTLQLFGSDPDEALAFEFEADQVTLGPGQQREIGLTVTPSNTPFISAGRLHGFLVTARSSEEPAVAGATQAQLEERAFLSPATLLFLVVAAIVMGFWYFNRPQPPTLMLGVSKTQVLTGEPIEISYQATHADQVTIEVDGQIVADGPRESGTVIITPKKGGRMVISGIARRQDKASEPREAVVAVTEPPAAPLPEIREFSTSNANPRVGQTVTVTYRFGGEVSKAFLQPIGELNLNAEQTQVPVNEPGKMVLTLIAENREGKTVKKTLTLTGKEESLATVVVFKVTPARAPYPGGLVKIVWQLTDAARAEITPHPTSPDNPVVNAQQGDMDVYVDKETIFQLTAWDSKSRQITKTIKVVVEAPPVAPPDESIPSGPGVTGGR